MLIFCHCSNNNGHNFLIVTIKKATMAQNKQCSVFISILTRFCLKSLLIEGVLASKNLFCKSWPERPKSYAILGSPGGHFAFCGRCRQWASAPFAARMVFLFFFPPSRPFLIEGVLGSKNFGSPWRPFWILEAVRHIRQWASAPFAARLVFKLMFHEQK